jgi:hypothetical protein
VLANALKGDAQSIAEIKQAVRNDPKVMEDVKRGVLDMIPRDSQGNLTANGMKKFIGANEGAIKELFGQQHLDSMNAILEDLQSQAGVHKMANLASEGGSPTAPKLTVAGIIEDTILGSVTPGTGGFIGKIIEELKGAAGIQNKKGIESLLFRAAMNPDFALELAKTPTTVRVFNALERLRGIAQSTAKGAATAGALEFAKTEAPKSQTGGAKNALPNSAQPSTAQGAAPLPGAGTVQPQTQSPVAQSTPESKSYGSYRPISENVAQDSAQPISAVYSPSSQQSGLLNLLSKTTGKTVDLKQVKAVIAQDPVDQATMMLESGGDPKAKNPDSSASGLYQLLKKTAKSLGVKDVFDPEQNYRGYLKLKKEAAPYVEKPEDYYAFHYLGALTFKAWKAGDDLTDEQRAQVAELTGDLLPKWRKLYAEAVAKLSGSVEA